MFFFPALFLYSLFDTLRFYICWTFLAWVKSYQYGYFSLLEHMFRRERRLYFLGCTNVCQLLMRLSDRLSRCWIGKDGPRRDQHLSGHNDRLEVHKSVYTSQTFTRLALCQGLVLPYMQEQDARWPRRLLHHWDYPRFLVASSVLLWFLFKVLPIYIYIYIYMCVCVCVLLINHRS